MEQLSSVTDSKLQVAESLRLTVRLQSFQLAGHSSYFRVAMRNYVLAIFMIYLMDYSYQIMWLQAVDRLSEFVVRTSRGVSHLTHALLEATTMLVAKAMGRFLRTLVHKPENQRKDIARAVLQDLVSLLRSSDLWNLEQNVACLLAYSFGEQTLFVVSKDGVVSPSVQKPSPAAAISKGLAASMLPPPPSDQPPKKPVVTGRSPSADFKGLCAGVNSVAGKCSYGNKCKFSHVKPTRKSDPGVAGLVASFAKTGMQPSAAFLALA